MASAFSSNQTWRQTALLTGLTVCVGAILAVMTFLVLQAVTDWQAIALAGAILVAMLPNLALGLFLGHQLARHQRVLQLVRSARTKLRDSNRSLRHRALVDGMTGLPNRERFFQRMAAVQHKYANNMVMIVDADRFKNINDSFGHHVGDQALMHIVAVLKRMRRSQDCVGRIGGEEFAILLVDTSEAEGDVIAEMIRREIEKIIFSPFEGVRHSLTVSIGLSVFGDATDRAAAMRQADVALFEAKRKGRNCCIRYTPGMATKPRMPDAIPETPFAVSDLRAVRASRSGGGQLLQVKRN